MFFALDLALEALPELGPRTRAALEALLPGPLTLLVPNPPGATRWRAARIPSAWACACPRSSGALEPLASVEWPVLQSSANRSGGRDARRIADVDEGIREGVDLQLDGGELPGHRLHRGGPHASRGRGRIPGGPGGRGLR